MSDNDDKRKTAKPTVLSLHRNTVEKRRKREMAKEASAQIEKIIRETDVRAYAFVAISADGGMHCRFDTGAALPLWAFPSTMAAIIHREIESSAIVDDWKPQIPSKA